MHQHIPKKMRLLTTFLPKNNFQQSAHYGWLHTFIVYLVSINEQHIQAQEPPVQYLWRLSHCQNRWCQLAYSLPLDYRSASHTCQRGISNRRGGSGHKRNISLIHEIWRRGIENRIFGNTKCKCGDMNLTWYVHDRDTIWTSRLDCYGTKISIHLI